MRTWFESGVGFEWESEVVTRPVKKAPGDEWGPDPVGFV